MLTVFLTAVESNDTLATATPTTLSPYLTVTTTAEATAYIGDGPYAFSGGDFDIYQLSAASGQTLTVTTTTDQNSADTILGLYNSSGALLAANDNASGTSPDSALFYNVISSDNYYVVVGAYAFFGSPLDLPTDPRVADTGPGYDTFNFGTYIIDITLTTRSNSAPTARADNSSANQNVTQVIDVLANDTDDVAVNPGSVVITTQPLHGTAGFNVATGKATYTPTLGYFGSDSFTYTVKDYQNAVSQPATVNLQVNFFNQAPVGVADSVTASNSSVVALTTTTDVLANDTDVDAPSGSPVNRSTAVILTGPSHGTASFDPVTNNLKYTPTLGYFGSDSLTYKVQDNNIGPLYTQPTTVTFNVIAAPPVANPESVFAAEEVATPINVLSNDTDPGKSGFSTVNITTAPAHGTVKVGAGNVVTYTGNSLYFGQDSFRYTVTSVDGGVSAPATVSLTVTFVNHPPVAGNDSFIVQKNSVNNTLNVLGNDKDLDGSLLVSTLVIGTAPTNGTASVNSIGTISYTPNPNFSGSDSFTYTVKDSNTPQGTSNVATVTIRINAPPVANPDTFASVLQETPTTLNILQNDTDDVGVNVGAVTIVTSPLHGVVAVDPLTGLATYTGNYLYFGPDSFTYKVSDGEGGVSNTVTVNLTVLRVNKVPIAADDSAKTPELVPVTVDVLANDKDLDIDGAIVPSTLTIVSNPLYGTASVVTVSGKTQIKYTPATGFAGLDQLTYKVKDNDGVFSNIATLNLVVGDPATLSGAVYVDANNNGVRDAGEVGIGGVTVTVTKTDGALSFTRTVQTSSDGNYYFANLVKGTYLVSEAQPVAFVDGIDSIGTPAFGATAQNDNFVSVFLPAGSNATNFNFGERGLLPAYVAQYAAQGLLFATASGNIINVQVVNGNLQITGDSSANAVEVQGTGNPGQFTIIGLNNGTVASSIAGSSNGSLTVTGVTGSVLIDFSQGGNDIIRLDNVLVPGSVIITTGGGNDDIRLGQAALNQITGDLSINAGDGANVLLVANTFVMGNQTIVSGSGNDQITTFGGFTGKDLTITAGAGDDLIQQTQVPVVGKWTLNGGDGNDLISVVMGGSTGAAVFSGGAGIDYLAMVSSNLKSTLTLDGGEGNNTIIVSNSIATGAIYFVSGSGADTQSLINTKAGALVANSGAGNDMLTVSTSILDQLFAALGAGSDVTLIKGTTVKLKSSIDGGQDSDVLSNQGNVFTAGLTTTTFETIV